MATEQVRPAHESHHRHQDENVIVEFARNSPFLLLSLAFHVVVLLLLMFITAQEPQTLREQIAVDMEQIESPPVEHEPVVYEEKLDKQATKDALSGRGPSGPNESHEEAKKKTEPMKVDNVSPVGMDSAVPQGDPNAFEDQGPDGLDKLAPNSETTNMSDAVDSFAIETINATANGETLVVLMIDRSRSIIYDDLPQLIDRMNHYFDEIDENLPIELTGHAQWSVISFGRRAKLIGRPSANLNYIKRALKSVQVDGSGKENVKEAITLALNQFGDSQYDNILLACLTDERGDDIQKPEELERTINQMRKHNARFFVFGYEAVFAASKKRVRIKLDEKMMNTLQSEDRAALRGFEGRTLSGWNNAGPAAPQPELWWDGDWHRWRRWGATLNGIRSGFGMYALNRMSLATRGTYFVLEKESDFDMKKMAAKYHPDICSKFTYKQRMKEVPLREALKETWNRIGKFYLSGQIRRDGKVKELLKRAKKGREYCSRQAKKLDELINNSKQQGQNWDRWIAHAELTRAELLRLRFMLGQYHLTLNAGMQKHGLNLSRRKKRYIMRKGKAPADYKGPKQAEREYNTAKDYIQICIDRHKNTPWAVLAKRMQRKIFPWRVTFEDWPEPPPPGENDNRVIPPHMKQF